MIPLMNGPLRTGRLCRWVRYFIKGSIISTLFPFGKVQWRRSPLVGERQPLLAALVKGNLRSVQTPCPPF